MKRRGLADFGDWNYARGVVKDISFGSLYKYYIVN